MLLKSLKINSEKLGSNSIMIADTYNNLGVVYKNQGKLNLA